MSHQTTLPYRLTSLEAAYSLSQGSIHLSLYFLYSLNESVVSLDVNGGSLFSFSRLHSFIVIIFLYEARTVEYSFLVTISSVLYSMEIYSKELVSLQQLAAKIDHCLHVKQ